MLSIVAGMEHGINGIITMPAGVSVIPVGMATIVPRISRMPAAGMDLGTEV